MVDIHCHILPGFDDGSSGLEESIDMAHMAVSSGVTAIVATPHFPGRADSLQRIPELLDRFDKLREAIRAEQLPLELHPGAEILCLPETPELAARQALPTIGNTSYFLSEFYFDASFSYMDQILRALADAGYTPVVAHPERYGAIQHDPRLLERWFARGYILQLNKGSLLGSFGTRVQDAAIQTLDMGLAHLIASDAHSAARRTPHMGALRSWLQAHCDPFYAEVLLERNPARLIAGREMVPAR